VDRTTWFDFGGQVVVVNGCGGIGQEIVSGFARCGASVIATDVDGGRADAVAAAVGAVGVEVDARDAGAVDRFVEETVARHGKIDVVVNTAAVYIRVRALELTPEEFDRTMAVNVRGTWLFSRAAGRHMVERGSGRIINYASNAGMRGSPLQLAYNASKAAVISMTKTLAVEWAKTGVTVNAVAPGPTDTELMAPAFSDPALVASFAERIPQGALTPADVTVGPVLFLASRQARWITGITLFADGGMSAT
jgi:NAD(P)-dependent dehydrogenase (short-subunit alcohol dehydrogenase family)